MDILCVGMFRSGSTWQYNVACELVERGGCGRRVGYVEGQKYRALPDLGPATFRVLKSHEVHDSFSQALRSGTARALYSYRDLRDVAYSLMHKFKVGFQEVLKADGLLINSLRNDLIWESLPNVLSFRYEEMITEPHAAIESIAEFIGVAPSATLVQDLAGEFSLSSVLDRTRQIRDRLRAAGHDVNDPRLYEKHTLLHGEHCRTGRVGTWKEVATSQERTALAEMCGQWLISRGYEADDQWASQ